ncbi:MAG: YihY/virulence factor BrkB family protein [Candidatus Sumerlaeaceae bacterium]
MAEDGTTPSGRASLFQILRQTVKEWDEDNVPRLGAALAYYAIFSIAPLALLSIAVASFFVGEEAARGQLHGQLRGYLGEYGAQAVQALVGSAKTNNTTGPVAVAFGVVTLLYGAGGVFTQLKESLNIIWGVTERKKGVKNFLLNRLISYVMVLFIGFLLIAAAIASTVITAVLKYLHTTPPHIHFMDFGISFVLLTILFGIIFKVLPDVKLAWRNVWLGAAVTSVLFSLGKMAIGFYLARGGVANSYGAAGSIVVLMIWVYYSAQIVFFGAEFTQVHSKLRSIPSEPAPNAMLTSEAEATGKEAHSEKATAIPSVPNQ